MIPVSIILGLISSEMAKRLLDGPDLGTISQFQSSCNEVDQDGYGKHPDIMVPEVVDIPHHENEIQRQRKQDKEPKDHAFQIHGRGL